MNSKDLTDDPSKPCPEHQHQHEKCGDACECCHGKKKPATWQFIVALFVILIISSIIVTQKQTKLPVPERPKPFQMVLIANASCGKCKPMIDIFKTLQTDSSAVVDFVVLDTSTGIAPFTIESEPSIIVLNQKGEEQGRITGIISAQKLVELLPKYAIDSRGISIQ